MSVYYIAAKTAPTPFLPTYAEVTSSQIQREKGQAKAHTKTPSGSHCAGADML